MHSCEGGHAWHTPSRGESKVSPLILHLSMALPSLLSCSGSGRGSTCFTHTRPSAKRLRISSYSCRTPRLEVRASCSDTSPFSSAKWVVLALGTGRASARCLPSINGAPAVFVQILPLISRSVKHQLVPYPSLITESWSCRYGVTARERELSTNPRPGTSATAFSRLQHPLKIGLVATVQQKQGLASAPS